MILLTVLILSLVLILPASASDFNEDVLSADEMTVNEPISENEKTDVELDANETYGIYGNKATELEVHAADSDGENVDEGTILFIDVFGKNYTAKVQDGLAKTRVYVGQTGQFNITCNYIGTGIYNNATTTLLLTVPVANTTCKDVIATKYGDMVYFTGNVVSDYRPYKDYGDFDDYEEVTEGFVTVFVDGERLGTCDLDVNGNYVFIWNTTRNLIGQTINFTGEFTNAKKHFNSSRFTKSFTFEPARDTRIISEMTVLENNDKLIMGTVIDENGKNVVGGTITINDKYSVPVDANGNFRFYITNETPKKAQYEIGVFDWGSKADIRVNVPLMNAVEHTELIDKLIDLCTQGSPYIKFGNGNGKSVVVNVGTHGGELPSQVAGFKLINLLANYGGEINGTIYVIPVVFPQSTANNTRIYNGINLNTVADVNGTISNHVVKFAISVNASGLGDFHNTRHGDSDVGITCAMGSRNPTPESQSIAKFIADETGYDLDIYEQAGVPYAGAIEDYSNILGTPAVTCESLSNHRAVEYGAPEMSYNEMRAFLRYFGFDVDEMQKIKLDDSDGIMAAFTSPYNYNPSLKNISYENTFKALQEMINSASAGFTINLEHDYEYDLGFTVDGITIKTDNITINGNGHTIDALNQGRIFNIAGDSITISNLNMINGFSQGNGGAIFSANQITLANVTFTNNNANQGGAIYATQLVVIDNCVFDNNSATSYGGSIRSIFDLTVSNSAFANSKSEYAAAIYVYKGDADSHVQISIENSTFENLTAEQSAGAIGIKGAGGLEIINCKFINTSSKKNGGAVFLDGLKLTNELTLENSTFINSCGDYGGALLMLSAQSSIQNCEFINNTALLSGGAIYASDCDININNTLIDANKLIDDDYGNGGGIYADYSTTYVGNCTITNNAKNGIYAYDNELTVVNTTFAGNGEAIHGVFIDCKVINIDAGNDTLCLNETIYFSIIEGAGKQLVLVNNTIDVTTLPSCYDSRQWGWVTPVRSQGEKGSCWAFGTIAALESALLKATGIEYNLSVNNMGNIMIKYSQYGITSEFEGGFDRQGLEYVLSWFGAFPDKYDTFDEVGKISPLITTDDDIHIVDALILGPRKNSTDNDALKRAIIKCGAVTLGIATDGYDGNATFYQNDFGGTDHQIAFVGWDDNYPASNFQDTPPGDGAFIIKNSWGTDKGDNGYFYISYYDTSILNETVGYGFLIENTENYIRNYQYDLSGKMYVLESNESAISYRNSYVSLGDELISAVGTYFNENEDYSVEIYVNDKLLHAQSGTAPFGGYCTVKLTKAIPVALGDVFTVVMNKTLLVLLKESRQHYINGSSQYCFNGTWVNASDNDAVCSLKVYTAEDDTKIINNENIAVDYDGGKYFSVKVVTADNRAVGAGASVKFNINGKTTTVQTDSNGIAKIKITDVPKKYTMTTTYKGKSVKNTVTVNQVLKATKVTVKKTAKKFTLKATLKINGKLVKGKLITFKFKGKTYKIKTNAKGIAQKTLKKSVIKKLKKGKTYTVKVTYLKDTIKTTVKVR